MLVRLDDVTNNIILDKHIKSKNTVLVSSSLQEGVDLKDDLSRFQIIVKLPWLSLADPRTKKLTDQNNKWYSTEMWRRLIQSWGRSTRSSDDSSDTFILDSHVWLWNEFPCKKDFGGKDIGIDLVVIYSLGAYSSKAMI